MFGSKEEKMQKYLEKGNWDKIEKLYLYADSDTLLALAQACGKVKTDVSGNVLGILIRDPEEKIQLVAVNNLGKIGSEHHVAELQQLMERTPEEKTELVQAIHKAIKTARQKEY